MRTLLVASLVLAGGCVLEEAPHLASSESHVETANRIASNRIASNRIASNRIASNGLQFANQDALVDTEEGRELLTYIISCALPTGDSVTLTDAGGTAHVFNGWIGVAPSWATQPATADDRKWVSACLLSRTNFYGISVPISLRGANNAALTFDAQEAAAFGLREGAFWGDLFDPNGVLYACVGPDKLAGSTASSLSKRECTYSDNGSTTRCGFTYAGPCADVCDTAADGTYANCGGSAHTMTVFLATP